MSEVISFRLDPNNPREAKALQTLTGMVEKGFSVRQIITDALIHAQNGGYDVDILDEKNNIQNALAEISKMLQKFQTGKDISSRLDPEEKQQAFLDPTFVSSIKSTIKPGIKTE